MDSTIIVGADPEKMVAKCGHTDPLGYLADTVCGDCARAGHRKAVEG